MGVCFNCIIVHYNYLHKIKTTIEKNVLQKYKEISLSPIITCKMVSKTDSDMKTMQEFWNCYREKIKDISHKTIPNIESRESIKNYGWWKQTNTFNVTKCIIDKCLKRFFEAPIRIAPTAKMSIKPKSSKLPESYKWQVPIQSDNLLSMSINKARGFVQIQYMM